MNKWLARMWIGLINLTLRWSVAQRARCAHYVGAVLWCVVRSRRRVALANLRACFPHWSAQEQRRVARQCFSDVARSVLDHSVLWKGTRAEIEALVQVQGLENLMTPAHRPLILVAPHFVGLDAGGLRVGTLVQCVSIYARQSNPVWNDALLAMRRRFNNPLLLARGGQGKGEGNELRATLRALQQGLPLYYLPDMDNGAQASIFVPFFGVSAATVPMVSRLTRITQAKVIMAVTEMTDTGYTLHLTAPWENFPGASVEEDTARMNQEIERWVERFPAQYLWTHRRFKTRPPGELSIYGNAAKFEKLKSEIRQELNSGAAEPWDAQAAKQRAREAASEKKSIHVSNDKIP